MQGGYPYGGPPPMGGGRGAPMGSPYGGPPMGGPPMGSHYGGPPMGGPPMGGAPMGSPYGGTTTVTQYTVSSSYGGGGGAPPPPSTGFNNAWYSQFYTQMNPTELYEVQAWFAAVDRDRSGQITANELANITFNGAPIGYPVAFKLIQVFDKDRSGSINFHEYAAMHKFMSILQNAFFAGDRDRSGRLDIREIHIALGTAGFQLSFPTVQALVSRYDKTGYGVTFPDFMMLCATVAQGRSLFEWRDTRRTGQLTFTLDQLLEIVGQMS